MKDSINKEDRVLRMTEFDVEEAGAPSPICPGATSTKLWSIDIDYLISRYHQLFNIDIRGLTSAHKQLSLCQCNESGLRYFSPADIVGDSSFYEQLEKVEWYYMKTKWEFEEALKYLPTNGFFSLLEIGSARGDFLKMVLEHNSDSEIRGLELNEVAIDLARSTGLDVLAESTLTHREKVKKQYDFLVSFQVLEHLPNPREVLSDMVGMLKVGGRLIIGVPDNSRRAHPSIFVSESGLLNMPPHHQSQWDKCSLSYLTHIFPLRLDALLEEPAIASHHSNNYRGIVKKDLTTKYGRFVGNCIYAMARPFYNHMLSNIRKYLPAHTIMAVYTKTKA